MLVNQNCCSYGPQNESEAKAANWHRIDCLAARQLKIERDPLKLKRWFKAQDEEWQAARKARFNARIVDRTRMYS